MVLMTRLQLLTLAAGVATFGVGHSSTSISAALGMAIAAKLKGEHRRTVAVIGDGAITAGMAFEGGGGRNLGLL